MKKSTVIRPLKGAKDRDSSEIIMHRPDLDGIELPPIYILVEDRISDVRKKIISKVKKYIAIMEFDAWLTKHGLEITQIEPKSIQKFSRNESTKMKEMITIIDNHFKDFTQERCIGEAEYLRLRNI